MASCQGRPALPTEISNAYMVHPGLKAFGGRSLADSLGFILLLALVTTVAWPYGAVTPFGVVKLELLAFAAAALSMLGEGTRLRQALLPVLLIAGIAVVGVVHLVPLSLATLRAAAPVSAAIYADTNEVLRLFGAPPARPRISIAPVDTMRATLLIAAYLALFIAATRLVRTPSRRRVLAAALLTSCVVHIVWAAMTASGQPRMHGLFVNPNHFAGYLQIGLSLAFAAIWTEIVTGKGRTFGERTRAGRFERRLLPLAWRLVVWATIAIGIVLTQSRMGIAAAAATILLVLLSLLRERRGGSFRYARAGLAAIAAALILVVVTTREIPMLRFLASDPRDPQSDTRFQLWALSLDAWRQSPHFGSGLGTFREAFRRIQPADFPGLYEQAHNDALQLLVTGGWISLALALAGLGAMLVLMMRGCWRRTDRVASAFALGAAGALVALLLHGLAEFNFSIPAIPATLAVVVGAGWSAISGNE